MGIWRMPGGVVGQYLSVLLDDMFHKPLQNQQYPPPITLGDRHFRSIELQKAIAPRRVPASTRQRGARMLPLPILRQGDVFLINPTSSKRIRSRKNDEDRERWGKDAELLDCGVGEEIGAVVMVP